MIKAKKFIDRGYEFDAIPKRKSKYKPFAYVCLFLALIPIISYFIFNGTTLVLAIISMFTDMNANSLETMQWAGFENFARLFQDTRFWKSWGVTLILATSQFVTLFIALIITIAMRYSMKSVRFQPTASAYVKSGSMNVTEARDLFLYSHVDRRVRQKESSSGGGSKTHTSSSGRSHGGGGGKF